MVQKAKCFTLRAIFHFHPCCLTIAGCLQVPARTPVAKASRVVSFMAGFCLHASCVSCVAAPSRPGLPHQGPTRSGSAGWLVQGANPAPDGKALATRGGLDKPTNDPCILSGGTTAQSTYMHVTQHSTCLSCWRLCMAACHRIMHGQGSNLVGAWSAGLVPPPCSTICSKFAPVSYLCPC